MPAPNIIAELVERFAYNEKQYCAHTYNEAQTRQESIDVFFEALGWDVANRKGYSERYKEVIHEDAIKVKGPFRKAVMAEDNQQRPDSEEYFRFKRLLTALVAVPKSEIYELAPKLKPKSKKKKKQAAKKKVTDQVFDRLIGGA